MSARAFTPAATEKVNVVGNVAGPRGPIAAYPPYATSEALSVVSASIRIADEIDRRTAASESGEVRCASVIA